MTNTHKAGEVDIRRRFSAVPRNFRQRMWQENSNYEDTETNQICRKLLNI